MGDPMFDSDEDDEEILETRRRNSCSPDYFIYQDQWSCGNDAFSDQMPVLTSPTPQEHHVPASSPPALLPSSTSPISKYAKDIPNMLMLNFS